MTQAFTPRAVEALAPRITAIVQEHLERVTSAGQMDVIEDLAYPLPVIVIAELLGIPSQELAIDWNKVIFNMLTIKGIYGREMFETWYLMQSMLCSGLDIRPVITHHFHYTEFEPAFDVMRSGNAGKVILTWVA